MRIFNLRALRFVDKATVRIAYDRPAVKDGVIGARELGPALLAISDLLEDANATLNGEKSTVRVNIRSGFEPGSFEINIEVSQTIFDAAQTVIGIANFYFPVFFHRAFAAFRAASDLCSGVIFLARALPPLEPLAGVLRLAAQ